MAKDRIPDHLQLFFLAENGCLPLNDILGLMSDPPPGRDDALPERAEKPSFQGNGGKMASRRQGASDGYVNRGVGQTDQGSALEHQEQIVVLLKND